MGIESTEDRRLQQSLHVGALDYPFNIPLLPCPKPDQVWPCLDQKFLGVPKTGWLHGNAQEQGREQLTDAHRIPRKLVLHAMAAGGIYIAPDKPAAY